MKVDGANPAPNTHSFARVPRTMRAVLLREFGGPELLRMEEVPAPNPATLDDDEVLIQVRACGICYHDIINRRGDLPRTRVPLILGHEIAGDVAAVGESVERFGPGDRVACVQRAHCNTCDICQNNRPTLCKNGSFIGEQIPGGYAEYAVVPAHALSRIPSSIPYAEASICACTIGTSIHVAQRGRVEKEDTVLITGASGGVGLHAIQVCKLAGANVIAITSSPKKVEHLRQAGADEVLVALDLQFAQSVKRVTKGRGVDVVVEITGSLTFKESVRSLAVGGRLVMVGNLETQPVDFMPGLMILKELEFIGSYATTPDELTQAFRLVEAGSIKPVLAATLPLAKAAKAHKMLFERGVTGRLALEI